MRKKAQCMMNIKYDHMNILRGTAQRTTEHLHPRLPFNR